MTGVDTIIPVSVLVVTRNAATTLARCLNALTDCDKIRFAEIRVVDSASQDDTAAIAAQYGVPVISFVWNGHYPKKRQWCLDTLPFATDWVLFVDADEYLTPELVAEIATLMQRRPEHDGYFIKGRFLFLDQPLRFGHCNHKLALFHRNHGYFPPCPDLDAPGMGEIEGHYQPHVRGTVAHLRHPLWHDAAHSLSDWFERHNRYADWEAALRADNRMAILIAQENCWWRRWRKKLLHRLPGRPLWVFAHSYIGRLGCFDGRAGWHFALARAFYYWQVGLKTCTIQKRNPTALVKDGS